MSELSEVDLKNALIQRGLKTTPHDKVLFPATNQTHYCWQKYNEWVLCARKDADDESCKPLRQLAESICPQEWVKGWDENRSTGNFLGVQDKPPAAGKHGHH